MPNRCDNIIKIHTIVDPKEFLAQDKKGNRTLHFGKLLPIAEGDRTLTHAHNTRGTKRDIYNPEYYECEFLFEVTQLETGIWSIVGSFNTARSPPTGYYKKLYKLLKKTDHFAHIEAYYIEMGVGFLGSWINGKDSSHNTYGIYEVEDLVIIEDPEKRVIRDKINEPSICPSEIPEILEEETLNLEVQEELQFVLNSYNKDNE